MNIKGMLVAVVMASSAAAMTGCSQAQTAMADQVAEQGASAAGNWFFWRAEPVVVARPVVRTYYTPSVIRVAPPAARVEVIGRAPSANHFWVNGYYRFANNRYEWLGGHWDVRRVGFTYVQGHWDNIGGVYHFVPGHFVRV